MDDYFERIILCPNCEGTGEEECYGCGGEGDIENEICEICDGTGTIECAMCGGDSQFIQNTETGQIRS